MVEVMKIIASFKWSHACTATLTAPNPTAGQHWPETLPETPGHSQASLGQSLVGPLCLSPRSWCILGSVCTLQESLSQSFVSSGSSMVGLMATSSKRVYAIPKFAASRAPVSVAVHCWPVPIQESLQHSLSQSLWGAWVLVHTRFVWRESGLILNVNSPLLLSCLGLSFALGHGVSPHSHSSAA